MKTPQHTRSPFENIIRSKALALEILLLVIGAALGVNLLSTVVSNKLGPLLSLLLAVVLLAVATSVAVLRHLVGLSESTSHRGVFFYDFENNALLSAGEYRFGKDMFDLLKSTFAEHEALRDQWTAEPLSAHVRRADVNIKTMACTRILEEAAEYLVLDRLSTHLTDFFSDPGESETPVVVIDRKDMPSVVLSNRILELRSRPIEDRPLFRKHGSHSQVRDTTISVSVMIDQDTYIGFDRFQLTLPKGCVIQRETDGSLFLDSPAVSFRIHCAFNGHAYPDAFSFMEIYLKKRPLPSYAYYVDIRMDIRVKRHMALSRRARPYLQWVESFLDAFTKYVSLEDFLDAIRWRQIEALTFVFQPLTKAKKNP